MPPGARAPAGGQAEDPGAESPSQAPTGPPPSVTRLLPTLAPAPGALRTAGGGLARVPWELGVAAGAVRAGKQVLRSPHWRPLLPGAPDVPAGAHPDSQREGTQGRAPADPQGQEVNLPVSPTDSAVACPLPQKPPGTDARMVLRVARRGRRGRGLQRREDGYYASGEAAPDGVSPGGAPARGLSAASLRPLCPHLATFRDLPALQARRKGVRKVRKRGGATGFSPPAGRE